MSNRQLAIAIPASIIADTPHLREKTAKIGLIGRAAAIFRVNEIIVYLDKPNTDQTQDLDLIELLLTYMETPQYLRKRLFPISPDLQYAGVLPPLRTAHHPNSGKLRDLKVGDYREGVAVSNEKNGTLIDIGSEKSAYLPKAQVPINERVTVKITKLTDRAEVQLANKDNISQYWGYDVSLEPSLGRLLESPDFDLNIGTSKIAPLFPEIAGKLNAKWQKAESILVLFGSPARGLSEIAQDEGVNLNGLVDFIVNTVPKQGTETVRTEEALFATLSIFNVSFQN
jgi:predicted SPOUT superfamily RNA methylase MTH1